MSRQSATAVSADETDLSSIAATAPVAAMLVIAFIVSTLVTPLYVLYAKAFGIKSAPES